MVPTRPKTAKLQRAPPPSHLPRHPPPRAENAQSRTLHQRCHGPRPSKRQQTDHPTPPQPNEQTLETVHLKKPPRLAAEQIETFPLYTRPDPKCGFLSTLVPDVRRIIYKYVAGDGHKSAVFPCPQQRRTPTVIRQTKTSYLKTLGLVCKGVRAGSALSFARYIPSRLEVCLNGLKPRIMLDRLAFESGRNFRESVRKIQVTIWGNHDWILLSCVVKRASLFAFDKRFYRAPSTPKARTPSLDIVYRLIPDLVGDTRHDSASNSSLVAFYPLMQLAGEAMKQGSVFGDADVCKRIYKQSMEDQPPPPAERAVMHTRAVLIGSCDDEPSLAKLMKKENNGGI